MAPLQPQTQIPAAAAPPPPILPRPGLVTYQQQADDDEREVLETGAIRQKKWAPRSSAGCFTCRSRRVKCDEAKPVCRRCVRGGHSCRGYATLKPPARVEPIHAADVAAEWQVREWWARRGGSRVSADIDPPHWLLAEALRYYYAVYRPMVKIDIQKVHEPKVHHPSFEPISFNLMMMVRNLVYVQKSRGRLAAPRADPGLNRLWETYYRQANLLINKIVELIQKKDTLAFPAICLLSSFGKMLNFPAWGSHLNGFLSLMRVLGGTKAVLEKPPSPFVCGCVLVVSVFNNTTSPPRRQVRVDSLDDDDVRRIYAFHPYRDLPCPVDLFLTIISITQFRAARARGSHPNHTVPSTETVRDLLDRASTFDPQSWAKAQGLELHFVAQIWAHIYRVAVVLYAILTLPPSAVASWAASSGHAGKDGRGVYRTVCKTYREELLALLRQAWPAVQDLSSLIWPLVVAGVAAADGAVADRRYVVACLTEIWGEDNADPPAAVCREKLIAFWETGSRDWDECFWEPTWSTC